LLVTSFSKEKNGNLHIMKQLTERIGPNKEQWFLSIIAEINSYLPDDWRMTKSDNNFRIQIITPNANFSLVGKSYRKKDSAGILSIIDTILHKNWFDKEELNYIDDLASVNRSTKKNYPELIKPNLYYFQPCPEDSFSPLFARQYERVKQVIEGNKKQFTGKQYHRIHPLTKAGLDLEHFKWLMWDINGNTEFVDFPDDDYHGKDFWLVSTLDKQTLRASEQKYIDHYEDLMKKYSVTHQGSTNTYSTPHERELKYLFTGNKETFLQVCAKIRKRLEAEGYAAIWGKPTEQVDKYFDDQNLTLYYNDTTFRMRKKKGNARITLKKRMPVEKQDSPPGLYLRLEEEVAITKNQEKALLNNERINPFPYRLIFYLAPECKNISEVMEVINKRTTGVLTDSNLRRMELCYDTVTYKKDGLEIGPEYEIEIESKGAEAEVIDILAIILVEDFGLTPSKKTKYERGVELLKISAADGSRFDK
jgi:uncharacterized protein YjbK